MGNHPSQVWRTIIEGRDVLRQSYKGDGNGESTHIWDQNWIPRDAMMRPTVRLAANPLSKVSELIDNTSVTWRGDVSDTFFLASDAQTILSISLCTGNMLDFWAWFDEKKGNFTVRTAYRMLADMKRRREDLLKGNAGGSNMQVEAKVLVISLVD